MIYTYHGEGDQTDELAIFEFEEIKAALNTDSTLSDRGLKEISKHSRYLSKHQEIVNACTF